MSDILPLSAEEARLISLNAQGFSYKRTANKASASELNSVMDAMKVVQLDAVPIVVRTQYLPFFSRLGNYDMSLYEEIAYKEGASKEGFYSIIDKIIKAGSKIAISISEKI